jgi:hypothetical protein
MRQALSGPLPSGEFVRFNFLPLLVLSLNSSAVRILRAMKDPSQAIVTRPNQTTFNPILALVFLINNVIETASMGPDLRMRYCFVLCTPTFRPFLSDLNLTIFRSLTDG